MFSCKHNVIHVLIAEGSCVISRVCGAKGVLRDLLADEISPFEFPQNAFFEQKCYSHISPFDNFILL